MPKHTSIRWTVGNAAAEFGIDPKTLSQRIKAAAIEPANDGLYGTTQITAAIFGDLEYERIGLTREQKEITALNKRNMLRELVPIKDVERVWTRVVLEYRQRVMSANIADAIKKDLLEAMTDAAIDEYFDTGQGDTPDTQDDSASV